MKRPSLLFRIARHLVLGAMAFVFLSPFIWMVLTSFKPVDEIFQVQLTLLPHQWAAIENYTTALTKVPLLSYLANGVLVCTAILLLQILVALPAAYAFAKIDFRVKAWAWRSARPARWKSAVDFAASKIAQRIVGYHRWWQRPRELHHQQSERSNRQQQRVAQ